MGGCAGRPVRLFVPTTVRRVDASQALTVSPPHGAVPGLRPDEKRTVSYETNVLIISEEEGWGTRYQHWLEKGHLQEILAHHYYCWHIYCSAELNEESDHEAARSNQVSFVTVRPC